MKNGPFRSANSERNWLFLGRYWIELIRALIYEILDSSSQSFNSSCSDKMCRVNGPTGSGHFFGTARIFPYVSWQYIWASRYTMLGTALLQRMQRGFSTDTVFFVAVWSYVQDDLCFAQGFIGEIWISYYVSTGKILLYIAII